MKDDQGFVTVAVVGLAAVLVVVGALTATLGAVAVARHRAAAAADLAALSAARHVLDGTACQVAEQVVEAQAAQLRDCRVEGPTVTVLTAVPVPGLGAAEARASAGPVRSGTGGNHSGL